MGPLNASLTRRRFLVGGSTLVGAAFMAGCASATGPSPTAVSRSTAAVAASPTAPPKPVATQSTAKASVSVLLWGWPGSTDGLSKLAQPFHKQHPDATIHFQTLPFPTVLQKFTAAMAAGGVGAPDICGAADYWVRLVTGKNGGLLDVTDRIKSYVPNFLPYKIQAVTDQGLIWGVPWDSGPVANVYRHDLLIKYGLKPADMDTWQSYVAAAATM